MNRFFPCAFVIGIVLVSCTSNHEAVRVSSSQPKYADKKIELEKLYVIDVTRINMFSKETSRGFDNVMDFDGNNNLYILDSYESTISVFDKNGQFIRSFGGPGQGPNEFFRPSKLFIKDAENSISLKIISINIPSLNTPGKESRS